MEALAGYPGSAVLAARSSQFGRGGRCSNVYVVDEFTLRVLKLPAGTDGPTVLPFNDLQEPSDVSVDAQGSVYVLDDGNFRVLELPVR